jgi:hypothetical protein
MVKVKEKTKEVAEGERTCITIEGLIRQHSVGKSGAKCAPLRGDVDATELKQCCPPGGRGTEM